VEIVLLRLASTRGFSRKPGLRIANQSLVVPHFDKRSPIRIIHPRSGIQIVEQPRPAFLFLTLGIA
jgi:hypothetical protein